MGKSVSPRACARPRPQGPAGGRNGSPLRLSKSASSVPSTAGGSDSLRACNSAPPGASREDLGTARMKSRLLYILLSVAVLVVAMLTAFTIPASAEKRTIYVKLVTGQVVPVTVDVPPGTPLNDIHLPGTPVTPGTPTTTEPSTPPPTTTAPAPHSHGGHKQPSSHGKKTTKKKARHKTKKDLTDTGGVTAKPEVQRHHHRHSNALRRPDGVPTPSNPGFVDALPGPSTRSGVPNFVIRKFRVPPFLLPIYQAAGIQYGVRWEILAAINEIETDYGRNLNVSSAGALGWMQFMPST